MPEKQVFYCEKCNRTMNQDQFYQSNNTEKYPERFLHQCKKCITMRVDNFNPDTYLWILQEVDVPYIPEEWNKLLATYGKDRTKMTGTTILGRYLSKMKLKQYRDYRWKDNDFLQELTNSKIENTMKRQGYDIQQITEAINKATFSIPDELLQPQETEPVQQGIDDIISPYLATGKEDYFAEQFEEDTSITDGLTEEDKLYLRLKWGKSYKAEEWVKLEQLYNEMMESYDIQTAGHIDTLKMVCKTSLKANQLLDIGDVDGAQKMIKMYDALMKSGKFTAAQNKAENGEYVNSVSELVAICETDGFIPRYYIDSPNDKVDRTIQDIQSYTRSLITEETNIETMIEKAMKDIVEQKEKEAEQDADAAGDDEALENELWGEEGQSLLQDEDFAELRQMEEDMEAADDEYLLNLLDEGTIK